MAPTDTPNALSSHRGMRTQPARAIRNPDLDHDKPAPFPQEGTAANPRLDLAEPAVAAHDWADVERSLNLDGNAVLKNLLGPAQCSTLIDGYDDDSRYRSRIVMGAHGFGRGEYKYFAYPLPDGLASLRTALYRRLAPIANRWNERMGLEERYPACHEDYLAQCHAAGQVRPTPLILRYGADDFNCLHQDLYGEMVFPLQVAILLSRPTVDFTGGDFVMTETTSKQQRVDVVPLAQGDAVVFTVNHRPSAGGRKNAKVAMRHGVSRVHTGSRHTVGLIFHDAK